MASAATPSWWPVFPQVALLDLRDGLCRVSLWKRGEGRQGLFSEPALLRRPHHDADFTHWGRRAACWHGRTGAGTLLEVFPTGWPVEPPAARFFLSRFADAHLSALGISKVLVVQDEAQRDWARELWRETLEDTSLSLQGFITDWQHDVLTRVGGDPARGALSPILHFSLEESHCAWRFLEGGKVVGEGRDTSFSRGRLSQQVGDHLRARGSLEVGPATLRALLEESCQEPLARASDLRMPVAGRQVLSGLPTTGHLSWSEFLAGRPSIVGAWQQVKARIVEQAIGMTETSTAEGGAPGEGLDLPGWLVLSAGPVARLFVEGPVVRMMERAL